MKRFTMALLLALAPASALADTWLDVSLVDHGCEDKVQANPDAHTTACLLQCAKSGYGIMADGKFLKFDEKGNEQVAAALKSTKKTDHLRVTVDGERKGDSIAVKSVSLD